MRHWPQASKDPWQAVQLAAASASKQMAKRRLRAAAWAQKQKVTHQVPMASADPWRGVLVAAASASKQKAKRRVRTASMGLRQALVAQEAAWAAMQTVMLPLQVEPDSASAWMQKATPLVRMASADPRRALDSSVLLRKARHRE
jgi:hypothetical protein